MADLEPTALGLDAGGWVAAAMLAVFALLLWKKIPAMLAGMLDKRIAEVTAQLESASRLRAEAESLKAEYEAKARPWSRMWKACWPMPNLSRQR